MALRVWDGGDDSDGSTWVKAYQSILNAAVLGAKHSVNDIWVASDHTEQTGATFAFTTTAATDADPCVFVSVKRADDSYELMATGGGVIESTGAADDITFNGDMEFYGLKFDSGDKMSVGSGADRIRFRGCTFIAVDDMSLATGCSIHFEACTLTLSDETLLGGGVFCFIDCTFTTADAAGFFDTAGTARSHLVVEDCDLSTEADLFVGLDGALIEATFRRCKLAAGWRADLVDNINHADSWLLIEGSEADGAIGTDPILGLQLYKNYYGTIIPDTTYYLNASDDTTGYSWKMVTTANSVELVNPLLSPDRAIWVAAGAQTITFYVANETAALDDDEFWVEISSPNESSPATAEGRFQTSRPDSPVDTPAALTTDAVGGWNGTPTHEQKVAFSITPTEAGWVVYRACLAKASTTIYFDPRPVVT